MTLYKEVRPLVETCASRHESIPSRDSGPWCIIVSNFTIPLISEKTEETWLWCEGPFLFADFSQTRIPLCLGPTGLYVRAYITSRSVITPTSAFTVWDIQCTPISVVRLIYRVSIHALVLLSVLCCSVRILVFYLNRKHIRNPQLKKSCSLFWNGISTLDESQQRKVNGTAIEIFTLVRKSRRKEDLPLNWSRMRSPEEVNEKRIARIL